MANYFYPRVGVAVRVSRLMDDLTGTVVGYGEMPEGLYTRPVVLVELDDEYAGWLPRDDDRKHYVKIIPVHPDNLTVEED